MVKQADAKHSMTWWENDAKYKARGKAMVLNYNDEWDGELKRMNKGKVGRPFSYSNSMMEFAAIHKILMGKSLRVFAGFMDGIWSKHKTPNFHTIWKRTAKTMPTFATDPMFDSKRGITLRIAADSTGIKHSNRGEWLRVKWNVKRGFVKLHILVDIDTRRILAFNVTDMNGGDAEQLSALLDNALRPYAGAGIPLPDPIADVVLDAVCSAGTRGRPDKYQTLLDDWAYDDSKKKAKDKTAADEGVADEKNIMRASIRQKLEIDGITVEFRGDGGYDSHVAFSRLREMGIIPVIKIRKNANARANGVDKARSLAVLEQFGGKGKCTNKELNHMTDEERMANQKVWKEEVRYGLRWIVENVISAFKRVFGEFVNARTPHTAIVEIAHKIAAYNYNLDSGHKVVMAIRGQDQRKRERDLMHAHGTLFGSVA